VWRISLSSRRVPSKVSAVKVSAISPCAMNVCTVKVYAVKAGAVKAGAGFLQVVRSGFASYSADRPDGSQVVAARSGGSVKVWRWWEALDVVVSKVWRQR
jgi:hypothetical protein